MPAPPARSRWSAGQGLAALRTTPEFGLGGDDQVQVDLAFGAPAFLGPPPGA